MSDEYLEKIAAAHLACRTFGHQWTAKVGQMDGATRDLELTCRSCKARRTDVVSTSGEVVSRRYEYPDGYLGHGRVARRQYRITFVRRGA